MTLYVLGIETSCDETGVAVYASHQGLLAETLYSQASSHAAFGGVVPELASREHIERLAPQVEQTLMQAGISAHQLDLIAYTQGPGLAGALLVGASFANTFAYALNKPVLGVHHLEGHLLSVQLAHPELRMPYLVLLVSGGHTMLIDAQSFGHYQLLGDTLDDAAGEAFDKSAKLLGLVYPGGAALAKLAQQCSYSSIQLPRPLLHSDDLNFSFSGLKTAVLQAVKREPLTDTRRIELAFAVEQAIVDVLSKKCLTALKQQKRQTLVVAGGVSANLKLRAQLQEQLAALHIQCFFPSLHWCTDNGAMIAYSGLQHALQQPQILQNYQYSATVKPRWDLCTTFG